MDSRIKIHFPEVSMKSCVIVSILVLMDSRIKIISGADIRIELHRVSILVLMDSRIKILLPVSPNPFS